MAQQDNINVNGLSIPVWDMQSTAQQIDDATQRIIATQGSGAITAGDVGAAKSGYGFGGEGYDISASTDEEFQSLFEEKYLNQSYRALVTASLFMPYMSNYRLQLLAFSNYGALEGGVFIIAYGLNGICFQRIVSDAGKWQPWEWLNPPMFLGIEYRTVERINGKPKYKRLISVGAMPNTTYIDVPISSYDIDVLLPPRGYMVSAWSTQAIPYEFSGANRVGVQCSRNTLSVITETDMSSYTGYFILEYSKTTD